MTVPWGLTEGLKLLNKLHKFVSHHIKSLGDADTIARKAANTLHNVGEYAALGSTLTGSDRLRDVGNGLTKLGESIHNVRRGPLANRARQRKSISVGPRVRKILE